MNITSWAKSCSWSAQMTATGVGSTYSDMQVLEEDKQCLPDQLELPGRETPVDLRGKVEGSIVLSTVGCIVGTGRVGELRVGLR